jgi:hypothetical protein
VMQRERRPRLKRLLPISQLKGPPEQIPATLVPVSHPQHITSPVEDNLASQLIWYGFVRSCGGCLQIISKLLCSLDDYLHEFLFVVIDSKIRQYLLAASFPSLRGIFRAKLHVRILSYLDLFVNMLNVLIKFERINIAIWTLKLSSIECYFSKYILKILMEIWNSSIESTQILLQKSLIINVVDITFQTLNFILSS